MSFDSDSSLSMDDVVWAMFIFGGQRNAFSSSPSFFSLKIVTGRVHTRLLPHQPPIFAIARQPVYGFSSPYFPK
jgi:hypothetical protein